MDCVPPTSFDGLGVMTPPCAGTADVGEVVVASTEVCVVLAEVLEVSDGLVGSSSLLHPATARLNAAKTATADISVWFTEVLV